MLLSSHFPKGMVDTWDPCFSLRSLGAGMLEVFRGFPMVESLKKKERKKSRSHSLVCSRPTKKLEELELFSFFGVKKWGLTTGTQILSLWKI